MNETFERKLWIKAQEIAREDYEEENGGGSWDDADKYEREDCVWHAYEQLRKVNNDTTNTNIENKKEIGTMMNNKLTKAEERTMKLAQAGYNTDNFFNLTLSVPFGKEVRILVDGKEVTVPTTTMENGLVGTYDRVPMCFNVPTFVASNGDICNAETGEVLMTRNDTIAQRIMYDGYVKNSKLFRRFIFAHTMKLIEYVDRKNPNRKGWEAGFKDMYSYGYCFEMLADELHTLAKLQKEDPEYFAERTMFFNGNVVVATLNDYLYRLKKYCKKQMRENPKAYRGQPYCKLAKYGNVLVKDLDTEVYAQVYSGIAEVMKANASGDYKVIEKAFNDFMVKYYNKLPYETPKCAVFKDAFKGIGAFESLKNGIRFHGLIIEGCRGSYDSERKLYELLHGEYLGEVWRFHQLLVDTIAYNNFDLRKSIAEGNMADGTKSCKAEAIARKYNK